MDSLILPSMHGECFEVFTALLAERHPDELIVLVCDGAASHTTPATVLPESVQTLTLPPYSPELNPIPSGEQQATR